MPTWTPLIAPLASMVFSIGHNPKIRPLKSIPIRYIFTMNRIKIALVWLASILACTLAAPQDKINSGLVNVKVERKVDVSSQLIKISNSISLENGGSGAVKSFLIAVEPKLVDHISFVGASVSLK